MLPSCTAEPRSGGPSDAVLEHDDGAVLICSSQTVLMDLTSSTQGTLARHHMPQAPGGGRGHDSRVGGGCAALDTEAEAAGEVEEEKGAAAEASSDTVAPARRRWRQGAALLAGILQIRRETWWGGNKGAGGRR